MRVTPLHMKTFRSIRQLDPAGDDLTLPIGENKAEVVHTPWVPFRGTSAPAGCPRRTVSRKGP